MNFSEKNITAAKSVQIFAFFKTNLLHLQTLPLIKEIRLTCLGCRLTRFFYQCLGYADDLLLMSASVSGLQSMVKICEHSAMKRRLKFSTNTDSIKSETKCISFMRGKQSEVCPIILNNDPLFCEIKLHED